MELQIIPHKEILPADLMRIIAVKSAAWPYPLDSQLGWIVANVREEDRHVLLVDGGVDRAYLSLSPVMAAIDGVPIAFSGVGCVCASIPGQGWGGRLMRAVEPLLEREGVPGLLFCKERMVPFYRKYGWELVPAGNVRFADPPGDVCTMTLGCSGSFVLEYADRFF